MSGQVLAVSTIVGRSEVDLTGPAQRASSWGWCPPWEPFTKVISP